MQKVALIIPCYNEEKRIQKSLVLSLLSSADIDIYLTNDGSTDNTVAVINAIEQEANGRCYVINYKQNRGKAGAIYNAANELIAANNYTHIGYFDADFSTPVPEIKRMLNELSSNPDNFIIGCRAKLLNSDIQRKFYRHIIGRIIVTIVNFKFNLGVYDTQCGAKIFPVTTAAVAFNKPFATSWLFDMEIFIRLRSNNLMSKGTEFPLHKWTDVEGSKLSWKTAFKIIKEIYTLYRL
jgi:dolichyl-phosphate beta-glucosyltransferase